MSSKSIKLNFDLLDKNFDKLILHQHSLKKKLFVKDILVWLALTKKFSLKFEFRGFRLHKLKRGCKGSIQMQITGASNIFYSMCKNLNLKKNCNFLSWSEIWCCECQVRIYWIKPWIWIWIWGSFYFVIVIFWSVLELNLILKMVLLFSQKALF
jgi:hypothetical protein